MLVSKEATPSDIRWATYDIPKPIPQQMAQEKSSDVKASKGIMHKIQETKDSHGYTMAYNDNTAFVDTSQAYFGDDDMIPIAPEPLFHSRPLSTKRILVCKTCGSEEVADLQWKNVNNARNIYKSVATPTEKYCMVCQCNTEIVNKEDFKIDDEEEN